MSFKDFLVRRLAKRFQMTEALDYFESMGRIGTEAHVPLPTDLLPMAARMFSRGVFTQAAIQPNLDWVLPYWAVRQYEPNDVSFIPRMSWSQFNLTHRNWTAVGVSGSTREVVVDPRGWVTPWFEGWSLDVWVELDGNVLFPSREQECRQKQVECLPVVQTTFEREAYRLDLETLATTVSGVESVLLRAKVTNRGARPISPRVFVSVRPFNPEGASLVHAIEAVDGDTLTINGALGLQFVREPSRVYCSNAREGDCSFFLNAQEAKREVECPGGLATAYAVFPLQLEPEQNDEVISIATVAPVKSALKTVKKMRRFDFYDHRADAKVAWREKLRQGMNLELPDDDLADSFYLCKSHLLLADDGDTITPGPMTYHHYWFRDSAYMVTALNRIGMHEAAHQKLLNYPKRQESDGFFLSQPGEWDSAGQAIWTLAEHFRITGDRSFLEKMFAPMVKGADWIVKTRKKERKAGPTRGLLPPGFSAEHFGPNDYYYWDDFWGVAGLRDVAQAAELLGMRSEWLKFEKEAESFLDDIRASLGYVQERLGRALIPAGPYRRFDSGAIGSVAALYPLRLLDPFDPLIENTLEAYHECCMYENGFFQNMIHSGINCYLTLHIAHCHLLRRETRAWPLIKYILAKATSTGTWPEAIHPKTGGGCMGDGMHMWAAADWLLTLRDLLLFEDGENLVLTPAPLEDWFAWGSRLEVHDAPTYFGPVSFRIEGREAEVVLDVAAGWRKTPLKIEFNLPFAAQAAYVDGKEMNVNDTRMLVPGGTSEIRIKRT